MEDEYDPMAPCSYQSVLYSRLQSRQLRERERLAAERSQEAAERAVHAKQALSALQASITGASSFDVRPAWLQERDALRQRAQEAARAVGDFEDYFKLQSQAETLTEN
jgi:hypothetical protein